MQNNCWLCKEIPTRRSKPQFQGLPVPTVGTSMAVTITHVFLWGSRATNLIENALMGSPCSVPQSSLYVLYVVVIDGRAAIASNPLPVYRVCCASAQAKNVACLFI